MKKNFIYHNVKKKASSLLKGEIVKYQISKLIKNEWVGVNNRDYYIHTFTIKLNNNEINEYEACFSSNEEKFKVGEYIAFRKKEYNAVNKIEAKSMAKTLRPEELAALNLSIQNAKKG